MNKYVVFLGVLLVFVPSFLYLATSDAYAHQNGGGEAKWQREDVPCSAPLLGCEKTYCYSDGSQFCTAQYCNAAYCL